MDEPVSQPVSQDVPTISRAPQAQAGAENLARFAKAWANWRASQVPTAEEASQGNIPIMPAGIVTNPGHGLAKLVSQMMPKAYAYLDKAPTKLSFSWLPGPATPTGAFSVGETAIKPTGEVVMSAISPADAWRLSRSIPESEQAAFWHAANSVVPHEIGHVLDAFKAARKTGTPELAMRVTPGTAEQATRIMSEVPEMAELFKKNVASYFPIIQKHLELDTPAALELAKKLTHNEVLVQSGAETALRNILKSAPKPGKATGIAGAMLTPFIPGAPPVIPEGTFSREKRPEPTNADPDIQKLLDQIKSRQDADAEKIKNLTPGEMAFGMMRNVPRSQWNTPMTKLGFWPRGSSIAEAKANPELMNLTPGQVILKLFELDDAMKRARTSDVPKATPNASPLSK